MASINDNPLKRLIEAENSHDIEKMLTFLADDIVIENISFGIVMRGKNSVKEGYKGFFSAIPDFKIEPKSWVTNDRSFAAEVILTGTQKGDFPALPASGKRFSITGCTIEEFENGKLKGRRDYRDSSSLVK